MLQEVRCKSEKFVFFSSRRRHTRYWRDWSSDVCSSDLIAWCARAAQHGGASWLAVATAEEAAELRRHGIAGRILVMGALTHERSEERRVGNERRSPW